MEIGYRAQGGVRALIESLGRTEDVRFSPSNRRLAIAAFNRSVIAVFDIQVTAGQRDVALTGAVEISSACLDYPHGLDFVDEETLVVANRRGDVAVLGLPPAGTRSCEVSPIRVLSAGNGSILDAPGSLVVTRRESGLCELLICNNRGHSVTRHVLDPGAAYSVLGSEVLLRQWINLPDSISISRDRRWIAVSNHNTHGVLLYRWSPSLDERARPDGVLRGVYYPHGLRFSRDGRQLFVADAGAPFVHIYASGNDGWCGARTPAASIRIMDEPLFLRGRQNPQEGGPKGLDLDNGMNILVTTSEHQPLAFFDLPAMLARAATPSEVLSVEYEFGILDHADRLRARAEQAEARAAKAEWKLRKRKARSLSARLRRAFSVLRRPD